MELVSLVELMVLDRFMLLIMCIKMENMFGLKNVSDFIIWSTISLLTLEPIKKKDLKDLRRQVLTFFSSFSEMNSESLLQYRKCGSMRVLKI